MEQFPASVLRPRQRAAGRSQITSAFLLQGVRRQGQEGADQPLGDELICLGDHRAPVHGFPGHDALSGAVVFVDQRNVANRRLELLNARVARPGDL